jgi:hypothetical protein
MDMMATLLKAAKILVRQPLSVLVPNPCEVARIVMVNQMLREVIAVSLE